MGPFERDPVHCIAVGTPRFDERAADRVRDEATRALARGVRHVVVDMSRAGAFEPGGILALAGLARAAPPGRRVALAALTPSAQAVARVTHLHEVFDIYATVEGAVAALSR